MGEGDRFGVFETQQDQKGNPVLHITGKCWASLATKKSYYDYHLRAQVKRGTKEWTSVRPTTFDSGIIYHSFGEKGAFWNTFRDGLEYQISRGETGSFYLLLNTQSEFKVNDTKARYPSFFRRGSWASIVRGKAFCVKSPSNIDDSAEEWNQVEIIAFEDQVIHLLNGKITNVGRNLQKKSSSGWIPLTKGVIQIQSCGAELFYRQLQIKNLDRLPPKYRLILGNSATKRVRRRKK